MYVFVRFWEILFIRFSTIFVIYPLYIYDNRKYFKNGKCLAYFLLYNLIIDLCIYLLFILKAILFSFVNQNENSNFFTSPSYFKRTLKIILSLNF